MDISVFTEKSKVPEEKELKAALADKFELWKETETYVHKIYPAANGEWNYPGPKYGWSYRIKDKKRAIIYLLPHDKYFMAAFVFGQKAYDEIIKSDIADFIKTELSCAKVYAEGRGVRIEVKDNSIIEDIKKLVEIKLKY